MRADNENGNDNNISGEFDAWRNSGCDRWRVSMRLQFVC